MYQNLLYEARDRAAVVTLNRPALLNALDRRTLLELDSAFQAASDDDSVRAVILTGAGEKAFAAGADIGELAKLQPAEAFEHALAGQGVMNRIRTLGKPVIAAVNGYALGGGCELALAATLRIASEDAVFGMPEPRLGLIPGFGGTQRLPRLVGRGRAHEMLLTGDPITAEEAWRIGLVNEVTSKADLMPRVEALVQRIARNAPLAVRRCLEALEGGLEMAEAEGQRLEAALFGLCFATEDMREGTQAFLEKRAPRFDGR